ncbi:hypothetical protein L3V77_24280 [Vibrio sp. DW001]|uniref:hypothetical protein n=1 Tax=Vibrio sp. DW001 TaxID=2912315 RepID=UPI0023AF8F45|nr:hypothetical protein [Vibrio sp. DW001]WED29052.1 hypothetical protein L3V77_24280 [Vibrio sp. DW001]
MRFYDLMLTPLTGKTFLQQNEAGTCIEQIDERVSVYFQSVDLKKYERTFDIEGYPTLKEYALDDNGERYSFYLIEPDSNGVYQPDEKAIELTQNQTFYKAEYDWAASQLDFVDLQLKYIASSDSRAVSTSDAWFEYARALRDYCSKTTDMNGRKTYIVNDISSKCVVGVNGRPVAPDEV